MSALIKHQKTAIGTQRIAGYVLRWSDQVKRSDQVSANLANSFAMWADKSTDSESGRRLDLIRDKGNVLADFFSFVGNSPDNVNSTDVVNFRVELESRGLSQATVYAKISRISAYFKWLKDNRRVSHNPVTESRPKAPKAYQNESAKALTDDEVKSILGVVSAKNDIVGKRDYCLLIFFLFTGKRRAEIINLKRSDIRVNGGLVIQSRVKGGDYESYEVNHPLAKELLLDYINATGRSLDTMSADDPVWLTHDRSGQHSGNQVSSHGFVKNLKRYAKQAGLDHIHLHQTRHTAAERTDSIDEAQRLLGHKHQSTTRVYKRRIGVKKDTFSSKMAERLGL